MIGTATPTLNAYLHSSPLGPMVLLFDDRQRLHFLDFEDNQERLQRWLRRQGLSAVHHDGPPPTQAGEAIDAYFAGDLDALDRLPRHLAGTPFQLGVWTALERIPSGSTTSYADLARSLGKESAVRAVAAAVGANPISLAVPCHRVVGSDGSLTGYAGGLPRKRWLLQHESGSASLAL